MSEAKAHWQGVYETKAPDAVSWFQALPAMSIDMIIAADAMRDTRIIDVGGGASTLADSLLRRGHRYVSVLDVAPAALDAAKTRLGERADRIEWIAADITTWKPDETYGVWHDRAVFHFLTDAADRAAYVATLKRALAPDGQVIIATFALDGPEKCSGLPVMRHSPDSIQTELGEEFTLEDTRFADHVTPGGAHQHFVWCRFRRI